MAYATSSRAGAFALGARVNKWTETLSARFAQYKLYRQTLEELSHLTERELSDLGLHRSQIGEIAYEAAYRN